ncbi:hypothetical protein [Streptomyces sp. NBC_00878]|uniref:hypothetical protein n=1 Tax=Streptomyces sp. NBC_00878 TaxID=2975854 RepID=UPI00225390ED|nr:hypothetical protein [Streptomyces sp. NBC_00878]MCX4906465.1 hypothetical protein [Streptomyces sp. NBC_00878]
MPTASPAAPPAGHHRQRETLDRRTPPPQRRHATHRGPSRWTAAVLYAQKISTISQLTVEDVDITVETVAITFGISPVILPMPLGALVHELIATRRGKAKIGTPDDAPWLFPGGQPGRPLSDSQVGLRLHKIGIRPQQDRSTALFTLAAELPAAILARMLGVHIQVAVQRQKASAGDWAAYAAEVSQRQRA